MTNLLVTLLAKADVPIEQQLGDSTGALDVELTSPRFE